MKAWHWVVVGAAMLTIIALLSMAVGTHVHVPSGVRLSRP